VAQRTRDVETLTGRIGDYMSSKLRADCWIFARAVSVLLLVSGFAVAQNLSSKLSQRADFIPNSKSPKNQLIELAQHYKLPMGIEWIGAPDQKERTLSIKAQPTVRAMIGMILQQTPGYILRIKNGVVNISIYSVAESPRNFLNLRIGEYYANKVNVFGAESLLRMAIARTLHPELYLGGTNGGFGYGVPREDGLDVKNISFSGTNLTVRDVLNTLVRENGNSLWVVELNVSKMMKDEPFFVQRSYGSDVQTHFTWQIIPLGLK